MLTVSHYYILTTTSLQVCALIKYEMEKALKLKVKLPVNIKVGDSWGTLQDYIPPDSTDN